MLMKQYIKLKKKININGLINSAGIATDLFSKYRLKN